MLRIAKDAGYDFNLLQGVLVVNEEQFERVTDKIRVALYDGDGKLIREVPASHATAMLSGERPVGWLSK